MRKGWIAGLGSILIASAMFPVGPRAVAQSPGQSQPPGLHLVIVEGEGAINNIQQRTAREPIVEVLDRNNRPVAGATVSFLVPESGASGTFSTGSNLLEVITNAQGRAVAAGFQPNAVSGPFQMNVTASFQGQTATATISQTNALTTAGAASGGGGSAGAGGAAGTTAGAAGGLSAGAIGAIIGGIAAAATVGAVAASGGGDKPSSSPATAPPQGTIGSPSLPIFGPAAARSASQSSIRYGSLMHRNGIGIESSAGAITGNSGRAAALSPVLSDGEPAPTRRMSTAGTALIAGAAVGAAVGTWLYLRSRRHGLEITPEEINFGTVVVGSEAHAVIALSNCSKDDVVVASIGGPQEIFLVAMNQSLPLTLGPGRTIVFPVSYKPHTLGSARERVYIEVRDSYQRWTKRLAVRLDGRATAAEAVCGPEHDALRPGEAMSSWVSSRLQSGGLRNK